MTYFFRLVRPLNLAIIGLTMYGIRFYLKHSNPSLREIDDSLSFFLLVISTIFIAAAGNIINDYFDVKADRINKPEKLIITKHIKKRWAIVTHWLLNGLGFLIALSFSIQFNSFSLAFIHLLSINALWFYSTYFKRKLFLGNLIVALLTAFIPLLVLLFYHILANERKVETSTLYGPQLILFLALFAFIQNLAREIIKDTQDIEGDKTIHVRSVPMKFGKMNALLLAAVFLCILPMFYLLSMIFPSVFIMGECENTLQTIPIILSVILNCSTITLIIVWKDKYLKLYDSLVKLSMVVGILLTIYLPFINL